MHMFNIIPVTIYISKDLLVTLLVTSQNSQGIIISSNIIVSTNKREVMKLIYTSTQQNTSMNPDSLDPGIKEYNKQ
jgi:hypothetical protein